jgi:hypothetical protein
LVFLLCHESGGVKPRFDGDAARLKALRVAANFRLFKNGAFSIGWVRACPV